MKSQAKRRVRNHKVTGPGGFPTRPSPLAGGTLLEDYMQIHPGLASRCMNAYLFSPQMGPEIMGSRTVGARSFCTCKGGFRLQKCSLHTALLPWFSVLEGQPEGQTLDEQVDRVCASPIPGLCGFMKRTEAHWYPASSP